jgi:4-hydroxy-3-polyprenylbenzoate decarboxylase
MSWPVVVGITGASGAAFGVKVLELLGAAGRETWLVVTRAGEQVLDLEVEGGARAAAERASRCFPVDDLAAPIASGSVRTAGMIVAPCTVRTLSAVADCRSSNLLERAADVTLKERRPLVLVVRETPLHTGHIRAMLRASEAGAIIMPPVPAFYTAPKSVDDLVTQTAARSLALLGIDHAAMKSWGTP